MPVLYGERSQPDRRMTEFSWSVKGSVFVNDIGGQFLMKKGTDLP